MMQRPFTGKHMAAILVGGFAIVIAVNFYMASLAVGGFGGVVDSRRWRLVSRRRRGPPL